MSVEKLIEELEGRNLVSDRVVEKLREKVAQSERPLSAKAIAKFLVEKDHLTQPQATELLASLLRQGVDVDPETEKEKVDDHGIAQFRPVSADLGLAEVESEDSSIFESFLSPDEYAQKSADEPELGLAPASDDAPAWAKEDRPAKPIAEPVTPVEERPQSSRKTIRLVEEPSAVKDELLEDFSDAPVSKAAKRSLEKEKKKKPTKKAKQWDSPVILLGGGGLLLLLIVAAAITWLMNRESGDDKLTAAQEALNQGAYPQAIQHYQDFVTGYPRHREHGAARVKLALAKIRRDVEASNFSEALATAKAELKEVEDEPAFAETAHAELAALLPRMAIGLAKQAEAAKTSDEGKTRLEEANATLALARNTEYVPTSLRNEPELDQVQETLTRFERRQQSQQHLQEAVDAMEKAIAAGDTRAAYAKHVELVKQHPELAGHEMLQKMIQKTTSAEQTAIRFVKEEQAAETVDRPTPWVASLAVANRRVKASAAAAPEGTVTCVRVAGAVYGIEAASGGVLWRRYVGPEPAAWPISIDGDVVVSDAKHHELLRLDATSGKLHWRQTIGEPFASPLVVGDRGFVAGESGRLHVVDWKTGARLGFLQFAQPLRVAPAADRKQERLYVPGDHSSLYTISLADLSCIGVHYVGHAEGSISVPLVPVMDKLVVLENDGVETSRLRLMSLGERGEVNGQVAERRLNGLASSAPFVAGRRMIVVTDRGQIEVHEVATGGGEKALTLVATRPAPGKQPIFRHAAIDGQFIWMGDTQLTKFSILPTGNRLPVESIENDFVGATFDHPLALFGQTLIHVHRPKGRAGAVVAATNTAAGATLWETDLAVPPAGMPVVDEAGKALAVANAAGYAFRFDEAAIRARVKDEPLVANSQPAAPATLTSAVDLGQGRAAFFAVGSDRILLYNPALGERASNWVQLESPLACQVTRIGDGLIVPTQVGQVFYLNGADGAQLAAPFQPILEPNTTWNYQPAAVVDPDAKRFVICDGRGKIHLVGVVDQPQPHLEAVAEASAGPNPIDRPLLVLGDTAIGAGSSHLVRFKLPSLEQAGESNLPAPVVWGPYRAGEVMLLATADGQLTAVSVDGDIVWKAAIDEHGDLAGDPLLLPDSVVLVYRKGVVERRALADGKPLGSTDVEHPLAAGPAQFLNRLVLAAADGTLLVVDQP